MGEVDATAMIPGGGKEDREGMVGVRGQIGDRGVMVWVRRDDESHGSVVLRLMKISGDWAMVSYGCIVGAGAIV